MNKCRLFSLGMNDCYDDNCRLCSWYEDEEKVNKIVDDVKAWQKQLLTNSTILRRDYNNDEF